MLVRGRRVEARAALRLESSVPPRPAGSGQRVCSVDSTPGSTEEDASQAECSVLIAMSQ